MSVCVAYSTEGVPPGERTEGWSRAVGRSYFPLDLGFKRPERFTGTLRTWDLGEIQASRLASEPAMYCRRHEHLGEGGDEDFLVTIPRKSPIRFQQMGREVECAPGGFILERGNAPYEFSYERANELIVAKIAARHLEARLPDPGGFCVILFDGRRGTGGLLRDLLLASEARAPDMADDARLTVGRHLVDLLALAVESGSRGTHSLETGVRRAHLRRIEAAIAHRHAEHGLGPAKVASDCGISLRYLHDLCRGGGAAFGERLRRIRLATARDALSRRNRSRTIAEIAYSAGFTDLSSFSRTYRKTFGETPSDTRARALQRAEEVSRPQDPEEAPGGAGVCGMRKMPRK